MVHGTLSALAVVARRAAAAPRPRKAVLELTDAAAERIRSLLAKRDKVRAGGRAGGFGEGQSGCALGSAAAAASSWALPAGALRPLP